MSRIDRSAAGILIAVALAIGPAAASDEASTGAVSGVVVDDKKEPLRRVLVRLTSADRERWWRTWTDRNGTFRFDDLGAGTYSMVLSKPRYNTIEVPELEVEGEETTFDVEIYPESKQRRARLRPQRDPSSPTGVYIPVDLDDALAQLDRTLPRWVRRKLREGTEDDLGRYHIGLGKWIRNSWGLWRDSRLVGYFEALGIDHPDDMSSIILTSYYRTLVGRPIELESQVEWYEQWWEGQSSEGSADGDREQAPW